MRSAYVVRRPVVNAYLVRERDRRVLRQLVWFLISTIPIVAVLVLYTRIQDEILRLSYRVESLETELSRLDQVERQLRLEAAYLAEPRRLAERARQELKLEPPRLEQVVFLSEWQ
jgi:cell division protein FtsL